MLKWREILCPNKLVGAKRLELSCYDRYLFHECWETLYTYLISIYNSVVRVRDLRLSETFPSIQKITTLRQFKSNMA